MTERRFSGGFTLVELMVTLVVIAILSAIALPIYRSHVIDARRSAAQAILFDALARQEQFFLSNKSYTATVGGGGLEIDTTSDDGAYQISVLAATAACPIANCFVLQAAPQGAQTEDSCGTLSLDSEGNRTPAACW